MANAQKSLQYWWLNANPTWWRLSKLPVGKTESYSLYNDRGNKRQAFQSFLDAAVGDIVIGYETTPVRRIVALLKVAAEQNGEEIYFQKTESLKVPIDIAELRERPELSDMRHFKNPRGSLFPLTEPEYDCIMKLIRAKNP